MQDKCTDYILTILYSTYNYASYFHLFNSFLCNNNVYNANLDTILKQKKRKAARTDPAAFFIFALCNNDTLHIFYSRA